MEGRAPSTPSEIARIRTGVETNPLFKYLDEYQKQKLIELARPRKYNAGSYIIREEDIGDFFYVIDSGEVQVLQKGESGAEVVHGRFHPGESFGDKAIIFETRRSASVKALVDTECWCIDRPTFHKIITSSPQKKNIFEKYASSVDDKSKEKVMRPADFMRSIASDMDLKGKSDEQVVSEVVSRFPRLATLFELVDKDGSGMVDYLEYCLFDVIASKPDPFFDFAFLLFDSNKKGYVAKEDVQRALAHGVAPDFDMDCSMLKRFFGRDGKRRLRFFAFTEFFLSLQEEIPRQAFLKIDKANSGRLDGNQFVELLQEFGHWRMPQGILERVQNMRGVTPRREGVTYAEFIAFNNLLNHLPGIVTIMRHAMTRNGGNSVTQMEFMTSAQMLNSVRPSPLELSIIYNIIDVHKTGAVNLNSFMDVAGLSARPIAQLHPPPADQSSRFQPLKEAMLNFLLGSIAGATGAAAVYPIDFVKTRLQNQPYDANGKGAMYKGIIDCFRKSIHNEGVRGLYRGMPAQLVGVSPEKAIKLATNDLLRKLFSNENKPLNLPLEILAGACAGGTQVVFTNPYELVKIRLQVQGVQKMHNPAYVPKSAMTVIREIGAGGLYKGASACFLRDIPFSGIYFPTYARTKKAFGEPPSKTDLLLAGAIAGCPAAYLCTPADVVKTRLQADAKGATPRYSGLRDCFVKTYQDEGLRTFFVGGGMRVFRSSPQFAVTLLVYEVLQTKFAPSIKNPRPLVSVPISSEEYNRAHSTVRKIVPNV